jgi:hypothetical protein
MGELFSLEPKGGQTASSVECLGMTFENDEARREHFLGLLREGLEELQAKLGGVPFTTVEDAYARMKSVEKWPMEPRMNTDEHESKTENPSESVSIRGSYLWRLAERMCHADSSKDLLQRWKDEVGFPHGEIEDILNLSDPPYYTACPNPFIADFIKHYGKPYDPETDDYRREPFAADTGAGKTHPIYTRRIRITPRFLIWLLCLVFSITRNRVM